MGIGIPVRLDRLVTAEKATLALDVRGEAAAAEEYKKSNSTFIF